MFIFFEVKFIIFSNIAFYTAPNLVVFFHSLLKTQKLAR